MRELLTVLVLLGSGVTAGVMSCVALSLIPAFRALPYEEYVTSHILFGRHFDKVMPPIVVGTVLGMTALLVVAGPAPLNVGALACQCTVSLVSQFGNVPINRWVKSGRCPAEKDPRAAWRRWHFARLAASLAALLLFSIWVVIG
ncbi:anthrone oxygenase family protein [Nocardia sp. NPDC051570]|uniref:anthrone oxygenase family protein n=1 Tax=Nocardia sp. NPDC051570 TaxID=3364324 RepID=UPI003791B5C0